MQSVGDFSALNELFAKSHAAEEDGESRNARTSSTPSAIVVPGTAREAKPAAAKGKPSDENSIWNAEDVDTPHVAALKATDHRRVPQYDIVHKQSVGSETVYFGMGDVDPSSNCSSHIVVKVKLPGQKFSDIDLDVQSQSIIVTSPEFRLATYLPYTVDSTLGSAKWLADTATLAVTLPIKS